MDEDEDDDEQMVYDLGWVNLNRFTQNSSIHRFPRAPSVWELMALLYLSQLINTLNAYGFI